MSTPFLLLEAGTFPHLIPGYEFWISDRELGSIPPVPLSFPELGDFQALGDS